MNRPIPWIAAASAVSLIASLIALTRPFGGAAPAPSAPEQRLRALEGEQAADSIAAPSLGDFQRLERAHSDLAERLARLEAEPRRTALEPEVAAPAPAAVEEFPATKPVDSEARAELEALLLLFGADYDFQGTPEEMQRFYALAREAGLLDAAIAELEVRVANDPDDLEARMELAQRYVAKILTIPHGAEQGLWGGKAEEQWRAVAERDRNHWGANYSLGNNFAYYPDVMGKTKEAIHFLEEARRIQEDDLPREEYVRVYLALSRLYLRQSDKDRARAVLEAGLLRHPSDQQIHAALEELEE